MRLADAVVGLNCVVGITVSGRPVMVRSSVLLPTFVLPITPMLTVSRPIRALTASISRSTSPIRSARRRTGAECYSGPVSRAAMAARAAFSADRCRASDSADLVGGGNQIGEPAVDLAPGGCQLVDERSLLHPAFERSVDLFLDTRLDHARLPVRSMSARMTAVLHRARRLRYRDGRIGSRPTSRDRERIRRHASPRRSSSCSRCCYPPRSSHRGRAHEYGLLPVRAPPT